LPPPSSGRCLGRPDEARCRSRSRVPLGVGASRPPRAGGPRTSAEAAAVDEVMRRLQILVGVVLIATACSSAHHRRPIGASGLSLSLPQGWHGLAAPGQLQAADFPLPRSALSSAGSVRVGRAHVHLIVWDYGPSVPYLARTFPPAKLPVAIRSRDLIGTPLEGFAPADAFATRSVKLRGEFLQIVADLGPKPVGSDRLRALNRVLATLGLRSARVLRPRRGRLARDGLALRLLPGWSGWIEIPPDTHATRLVLRARRRGAHLVLLELPRSSAFQAQQARLPIVLTTRNIIRQPSLPVARRVFSANGRNFDLSVAFASPSELGQVNRLLATLSIAPRSWTFRSCDLTLRLPGTWTAAVNPRDRCYPVITLRARGLRVVFREVRPHHSASGQTLRRSGRTFQIRLRPHSEERRAERVLGTLEVATRR
jgi:hypothetical protein